MSGDLGVHDAMFLRTEASESEDQLLFIRFLCFFLPRGSPTRSLDVLFVVGVSMSRADTLVERSSRSESATERVCVCMGMHTSSHCCLAVCLVTPLALAILRHAN